MLRNAKMPTIWFNVTTSANWKRPPVGVVRVEQTLCEELSKIYSKDRFKRCIWHENQFIEYVPKASEDANNNAKIKNINFPDSISFDLIRQFLIKTFSKFKFKSNEQSSDDLSLSIFDSLSMVEVAKDKPCAGDILITIGLDWDHPYTQELYNFKKKNGLKIITCCYDLIPVLFPQYCVGDVAQRFKEYFTQLSWGSDVVLCISKQTKQDFLDLSTKLGSPECQTCVIPLGDNIPSEVGEISKQIINIVEKPYILFVSTIERRKNHEILYRAYHLLVRSGHYEIMPKLVFVGMTGWGIGDLLKDIEFDPFVQGLIIQLNHVNDAELNLLYKQALFCVYPSFYEGWGLPVGEALALGKAVISSNQGSLSEVGGDLVTYVDPWNPHAWAAAILNLIRNPTEISALENAIKQKYQVRSWHQTANVISDLVEQLSAHPQTEWQWLPGYDQSTQVGIHVGGSIVSSDESGFLLFGPHQAIPKGCYDVSIFGKVGQRGCANAVVDVVVDQGRLILGKSLINTKSTNDCLVVIQISIDSNYNDLEVRIMTNQQCDLTITLVKINRT